MSEKPSTQVTISPEGQLVASEAMEAERKARIGQTEINLKRRFDALEHEDVGLIAEALQKEHMGSLEFIEKEDLIEGDLLNASVAKIDEKMLDIDLGNDADNPASIKARNDLRDIKEFLVDLPSKDIWAGAFEVLDRLQQDGDIDGAEVAEAAIDFMRAVSLEPYGEDGENSTQAFIGEHNQRIKDNDKRRKQVEQRKLVAGIKTRS